MIDFNHLGWVGGSHIRQENSVTWLKKRQGQYDQETTRC